MEGCALERPKIVNIINTGRFPHEIGIKEAYSCLNYAGKIYEPEAYPILLVKFREKEHHLTIYANGRLLFTVLNPKRVGFSYAEIVRKLKEFNFIRDEKL